MLQRHLSACKENKKVCFRPQISAISEEGHVAYRNLVSLSVALVFCASLLIAQSRPSSEAFCESVHALLQASHNDFNGIKRNITRHKDGSTDWVPSITVAGTTECAGQSDPEVPSSVSCTGAVSQSQDELEPIYQNAVKQLRTCLDRSFVFSETNGGKVTRLSTPIKEATFEVKGKDLDPDGPAVRIEFSQFHGTHRTEYEITIWVDAKGKE